MRNNFNYYNQKLHNLYIVTFIVHKNSILKNKKAILRNIIKKVLEDNGYYYVGTTLYIKYVFNNYNIDFGILSFLEEKFILESIEKELLNRKLNIFYMNYIELHVIAHKVLL
ncbi:hypothetical protein [uncultured Brachyspira sp.]|uniref:hypothetical protein n=1 Tax=uncultured Brachyspira sp. TaxID=221953 RepID=UPI0025E6B329|nr:hypothetical protein [uncultured Brachyspira sp.]